MDEEVRKLESITKINETDRVDVAFMLPLHDARHADAVARECIHHHLQSLA